MSLLGLEKIHLDGPPGVGWAARWVFFDRRNALAYLAPFWKLFKCKILYSDLCILCYGGLFLDQNTFNCLRWEEYRRYFKHDLIFGFCQFRFWLFWLLFNAKLAHFEKNNPTTLGRFTTLLSGFQNGNFNNNILLKTV